MKLGGERGTYRAPSPHDCSLIRRRPGILVLINEVDWELEGTLDYALQPSDALVFISTLHGG